MQLDDFKHIWELAQDPPRKAKLDDFDVKAEGQNPLCGDWLEMRLKLRDGKIADARFLHTGCALSSVASSLLLEYAEGKTIAEMQKLTPEEHLKIFGAPVSPARLSCVMLALETLKAINEKPAFAEAMAGDE